MPLISYFPVGPLQGGEIKYHSGTITAENNTTISVSGLSFTPIIVVVFRTRIWGGVGVTALYAGPNGGYSVDDETYAVQNALASYDLHQGGFTLTTNGDNIVTAGNYAYTAYYIE